MSNLMMGEFEFEQLLDSQRQKYGLGNDPYFEPGARDDNFNLLFKLIIRYPNCKSGVEKLMCLESISTTCRRYLDAVRSQKNVYAPRFFAVMMVNKDARKEIRILRPDAKFRARDNFLKMLPESLQDKLAAAKANAAWSNLAKMVTVSGSKRLNKGYWKEIFDPKHRPHHLLNYDEIFKCWLCFVSPYWDPVKSEDDGRTPNPDYDPANRDSFFDALDESNVNGEHEYKYLRNKVEREAYRVVVKGQGLWRGGRRLDTTGWKLNNGNRCVYDTTYMQIIPDRHRNYPPSYNQSMVMDHGIWVMSTDGEIYSGPQITEAFEMHHSGFLAGAPVRAGGEWHVVKGELKVITGSSGHYTPNFKQFQHGLQTLLAAGYDLKTVAAEWPYEDERNLRWFNAAQLAQPSVKAQWPGGGPAQETWPKSVGRPLREVEPMRPAVALPWPPKKIWTSNSAMTPVTGDPLDGPSAATTQKASGKLNPDKLAAFNKT